MKKTIVIIPTYNELTNVQKIVHDLLELYPDFHILIVDDNSPDGTGKRVREMGEQDNRIQLIEREGKLGLGTAYVKGFQYAIKNDYDIIVQMDADYSHDPNEIKTFLNMLRNCDVVIGSRYVSGVNVINWPMARLLLSWFANKYTKVITGLPLQDSTGGFKCFKKEVLQSIKLDRIGSNGYAFQIEMNFYAWKNGYKLCESPIIFTDRVEGDSKMSKKIVYEAVFMVWKLRFRSIFGLL
ncbi:MAG: polyprenol monophosphomannose synthase [Melioribacteraceae bacterium]|nr:polyprenol monophosphomannose synthase [Melioribacteraceae bacterium]MCF8393837.1 polyprenol monophosphomannose synthase [Melioribacteraceae bacterium]MCF8418210.1 polyprenol monophosphomannose synthase [Melioribacteraceae bacterium]